MSRLLLWNGDAAVLANPQRRAGQIAWLAPLDGGVAWRVPGGRGWAATRAEAVQAVEAWLNEALKPEPEETAAEARDTTERVLLYLVAQGDGRTAREVAEALSLDLRAARSALVRGLREGWLRLGASHVRRYFAGRAT